MKNLLVIFGFSILFLSCNKVRFIDNGIPGPDLNNEIVLLSQDGTDLLDSTNNNSFNLDAISYYYLENGIEYAMVLSDWRFDNKKGYSIYERDGVYRFRIDSHRQNTDGIGEYIVKWDEKNSDTITFEYNFENPKITRISRIWHQDSMVWDEKVDTETNPVRSVEIIREKIQ